MNLDPLVAKSIPGGYTWTLPSRLGQILQELEALYGPRNKNYTILGIEFEETGPRIWYPGNCRNIVIQLSMDSRESFRCALYELAHEAVHLLSPSGTSSATVLEEGLATLYAWTYVKKVLGVDYRNITKDSRYRHAALLVECALEKWPHLISEGRKQVGDISRIDEQIIKEICPMIDAGMARILGSVFADY